MGSAHRRGVGVRVMVRVGTNDTIGESCVVACVQVNGMHLNDLESK